MLLRALLLLTVQLMTVLQAASTVAVAVCSGDGAAVQLLLTIAAHRSWTAAVCSVIAAGVSTCQTALAAAAVTTAHGGAAMLAQSAMLRRCSRAVQPLLYSSQQPP